MPGQIHVLAFGKAACALATYVVWKFPGATIWATGPSAPICAAITGVMSQGECSIRSPELRRTTVMRASKRVPASFMGYAQSQIRSAT